MYFVSSFGHPSFLVSISRLPIPRFESRVAPKVYNIHEITFIFHENMNAVIIGIFQYL